jgi:putative hemolysin
LSDGTFLVDASTSIRDLREDYKIEIPESSEYETLGGFLLITLQRIPKVGDIVAIDGKKITISEMVGQRIAKVKLEQHPEEMKKE